MLHRNRFALLALLPLAACDDNGFVADRLTPSEVSGTYSVCTLRFRPENALFPVADLLTSVMDTTPPSGRPRPSMALSASVQQYDLVYTRQRDGFLQQLRGTTGLGATTVTPRFYEESAGAVATETLLPSSLDFSFHASPRRLTDTTGLYTVRRSDYAAAAGISETGLQERVSGRLEASLQVNGCP
jgi:hypothetical protein